MFLGALYLGRRYTLCSGCRYPSPDQCQCERICSSQAKWVRLDQLLVSLMATVMIERQPAFDPL
jgi:hypothetical protein